MRIAILKTIIYADIFNYSLKAKEIWEKLIWQRKIRPSKSVFDKSLKILVSQKKLIKQSRLFFLPGRENLVEERQIGQANSEKKLIIAKRAAKILSFIPTVRFVGLTGSVASFNAKRTDDIDFLIVAAGNWLWTTRFLANIMLGSARRKPGQSRVNNKICLNMFVDEKSLAAFSKNKNLFVAYELAQLIPLYDKNNIYGRLIGQNSWAKEFLPNAFGSKRVKRAICYKAKNKNLIEKLLMKFQLMLMANKRTTEIATENLIIFHPKDRTSLVLAKFKQRQRQVFDKRYFSVLK